MTEIAEQLLSTKFYQPGSRRNLVGKAPVEQALPDPLSERELEILRLIMHGLSNQEIIGHLYIAMSTLKTHINHIYSKLSVRTRTQAIFQAHTLKLVE